MKTTKLLLLLWAGLVFSLALANDPWGLEVLEQSALQGIEPRSREDALGLALDVDVEDLAALFAELPQSYLDRFENLGPVREDEPRLRPGEPLYVETPFRRDTPPPPNARIRRLLIDKAKRFLARNGVDAGNADYDRWLELAKTWYWRDVLTQAGPRYVVPLFNARGECMGTVVVPAWKHPGSIDSIVTTCQRNYPYLNQDDARKRLAEEGLEPVRGLVAAFLPGPANLRPLGVCDAANTYGDGRLGVWTDGVHAVGVASGNVYRLTQPFDDLKRLAERLRYAVQYVQAPDEDPRRIAPVYPGFFELVGCGDPNRNDYEGTRPLARLPLSAMPARRRSDLLERQLATSGPDRPAPEAPRRRFVDGFLFHSDVGTLRSIFGERLSPWALETLAALPEETPVMDVLQMREPYFVRSLVRLPENPPSDPLVHLALDAVARDRMRVPLGTPAPTLEEARKRVWTFTRSLHGSRYYTEFVDENGRCVLMASVPPQDEEGDFGEMLAACRNPYPVQEAAGAAARFRSAGVEPQGPLEAVLLFHRPDPRTPTCPGDEDALLVPYWSDGRYALNGQSGNLYRILPEGLNYLTQAPEPYPWIERSDEDEAGLEFLIFYLPVRLEPVRCASERVR